MRKLPEVWPVIHVRDPETSVTNAGIARDCGAAGVFLISMHGADDELKPIRDKLKRLLPDLKIGVNYLTENSDKAIARSHVEGFDATWSDYRWGYTTGNGQPFFAPVAFKGTTFNDPDPWATAREAVARGFIPMTSGHGTGVAAPLSKIVKMRRAIGPDAPLAMSGVDVMRLAALSGLVTHFLIATCISKDFYRFDESMLRNFMGRMK